MVAVSAAADRPLRADAERNRQRILAAAAGLFAQRGLDVSMEEIAAGAGVGVGTLYRRFADRETLIDALFEEKIAEMAQLAHAALEHDDPWVAFETFFRSACHKHAEDRGLREVLLSSRRGGARVAQARETMRPLGARLIAGAQAAGALRPDLGPFDLPMLQFCVGYVADTTAGAAPAYYERVMTVMLDGMRARGDDPTPMPVPPLSVAQFERAVVAKR